jgi:2-oxoglutarate ferredoxin oxidoreductase subunit delta
MAFAAGPIAPSEFDRSSAGYVGASLMPLEIAEDRCKGCELCVAVCPRHVLALDESVVNGLGYHPVRLLAAEPCTSCALCARICPDAVFSVYAPPKAVVR